uniref:Uncharacterized protein n=1 Tax=Rhizophora mucronata TaxID=61149 RepID=A0A2P2IZV7_RHIMU
MHQVNYYFDSDVAI